MAGEVENFEISSDGRTVWVNGEVGLLGRFGWAGIDIHKPLELQNLEGECLFCTHSETTKEDWEVFKTKMKECFGIEVPDKHKPKRLQ